MRWRIWFYYNGRFKVLEDSGFVEEADSPGEALRQAHARGCGWGRGFNANFKKAIALPADITDDE